jgi:hypothetical protein
MKLGLGVQRVLGKRWSLTLALAIAAAMAGLARADYPMVDRVADKIIQKYENATCQQLYEEKAQGQKPKGEAEQRAIQLLREDAGARAEFFNRISAPVVTKMFECGMVP